MKKRASNISFILISFLISYQTGFLLSQSSQHFGFLNFDIGFDIQFINNFPNTEVATLVNEALKPGTYEVEWDGSSFASGVYFYSLIMNEFSETKKLILLK